MNSVVAKIIAFVRSLDWWLLVPSVFLVGVGLVMHYSIGVNQAGPEAAIFSKQLLFVGIGFILFLIISFIDIRTFKTVPWISYGIAVAILLAVLIFGETIKGTTGWFIIGSFSFQPVELVKILVTLFIATFFSRSHQGTTARRVLVSGVLMSMILALVLLQPDLGSAFILFVIWFGIILMMRPPKRIVALIVGLVVVGVVIGWFVVLQDYQKDRLLVFMDPSRDARGSGYNITQALVAVGSGGLWGKGLGLGTQSQLNFLPEVASDFIFALVAEELGFIGVMGVLFAVFVLCGRLWFLCRRADDDFIRIVLGGILMYFFTQSFFTIGMNMGLLPVTGLPLPFVSAGGSSMIATFCFLGLAHSFSRIRHR